MTKISSKPLLAAALLFAPVYASSPPAPETSSTETTGESKAAQHLFVWVGDADRAHSDFLAVIDARADEPSYGRVVATLPIGAIGTMPHHTEYEFPPDGLLFANGWLAGRSVVLDLNEPRSPRMEAEFTDLDGYSFPHSFARLPDGRRLATFQGRDGDYGAPGGLVEIDTKGRALRSVLAVDDTVEAPIWPYSLVALPEIDRAVVTSSEMGMPPWKEYADTWHVQIWSLSDLSLQDTVTLPDSGGPYHLYPAEPRRLADGSVMFNTFSCGLYRIVDLEKDEPSAELVHTFPGDGTSPETECAGPVVVGDFWIQAVAALPGIVVLDVSDPGEPIEVARLVLDASFALPHWVAADRTSNRLVITGVGGEWALIANLNTDTGALSLDERFREEGATLPGIRFDRTSWPHGDTGPGVAHGALFGK